MPTFVYAGRDNKARKSKVKSRRKLKTWRLNILRERSIFVISLRESGETGLAEIQIILPKSVRTT